MVSWTWLLGLEFAVWADKANAVTAALCCHTWSTLCHVQSCCVTLRFVVVVVVVVVFVRFTADKLVDMLKNVTILIQGKNLMWFKKWNIRSNQTTLPLGGLTLCSRWFWYHSAPMPLRCMLNLQYVLIV
jgi:hypothetical protein